ncbi:hypothetical protein A2U01_0105288, partial [Trifolium medium]|nr:hypothetical protein [Trifolium medium]
LHGPEITERVTPGGQDFVRLPGCLLAPYLGIFSGLPLLGSLGDIGISSGSQVRHVRSLDGTSHWVAGFT